MYKCSNEKLKQANIISPIKNEEQSKNKRETLQQ